MANRPVAPTSPVFLSPPFQYDAGYMGNLSSNLNILVAQIHNPGDLRASTLTLTDIPTNDTTLAVGGVFQVDGFLKISRADNPNVAGLSGTSGVGTVTVTIS